LSSRSPEPVSPLVDCARRYLGTCRDTGAGSHRETSPPWRTLVAWDLPSDGTSRAPSGATSQEDSAMITRTQPESRTVDSLRVATGPSRETEPFGSPSPYRIALSEMACAASVTNLNQLLADTMILRDLYKKHHWQVSGPSFHSLDLLFEKHHVEREALVDALA